MNPRIFVSAVTAEFGQTRQLVANILSRLGYEPDWEDIFGTESGDLRQMLREKIDDCDGLIQLVGRGYGAEPPTVGAEFTQDGFTRVSYTQFEFLHARARGKKTWLIFAGDACTPDHPLEELDLPRDPAHPDPAGYQAECRALQEAWRQRWKQKEHVYYEAANDPELELTVERLKDEFAELRKKFEEWQRDVTQTQSEVKRRTKGVFVFAVVLVIGVAILLGAVGSIHRQQQKEWLANEAARQKAQKIEQIEQEFADRFLHQLLANKEITAEDARQRALKELPAWVKLPLEEIQTLIDRRIPAATPEAPGSPLDRARTALALGNYDDVFVVVDEQRPEDRELAMLEGTAALARFRESPKPEWNDRALAAFRRALALSDKESKDWTDAAIASAFVLYDLASYPEAKPLLVETQRILEDEHGKESSEVAVVLNNLAQLLNTTNRLAEAEPLMRRALALDEQFYGAKHPIVARDLNNLARLLQATNRLAEAEPLMRRALAIDEQCYGAEHPDVSACLNNLALLLQATNRLAKAEPLMRRALAIDEQCSRAEHPDVARDLNSLATLYYSTKHLEEAEPLMRRALAIFEQSYGGKHPHVAVILNNLAQLLQDANRLAEAEPLMRRALAINEQFYGADHPNVATNLNNLAWLLQDTNRLAEVEPLYRRALAIDEKSYGPEHPDVARDLNNLAQLLQDTNRLEEAEPLMRRCIIIRATFGRKTGHEHPNMQRNLVNFRGVLQGMKLREDEIAQRVKDATESVGPLKPIVPEVERLLGPAKPVADVLAALDTQYKTDNKPPIYFLRPDEPISPHLDQLLGRSKLDVPLNEPIVPHLEKLLGPAKSTKEVLETLDRQYREQGKSKIWFLPLDKPIAPLLDDLLGPVIDPVRSSKDDKS